MPPLLPDAFLSHGHPVLAVLTSLTGESPRLGALKAAGLFRGPAAPTNRAIREQMARQAELWGLQSYAPPHSDAWLFNYRSPGRRMRQVDAALLAASFGLPLAAFGAAEPEFRRAVDLSRRLRERGLNPADGSFAVLAALADDGGQADASLAVRRLVGEAPVVNQGAATVVAVDQHLCFAITPPSGFGDGCQIILLEQDGLGGVYCLAPSRFIKPRPLGFAGAHIVLPPETDNEVVVAGRVSLGIAGHSVIAAIITRGSPAELPGNWWDNDLAPRDAAKSLAAVIDQLTMRDPATWRVVTKACIVQ